MKSKTIFTRGKTGEGVVGDPSVDTRHGPKTKSFGYQVLGFGSGGTGPAFVTATGGSPCSGSICGDYKMHKFTGPGTLCVSCAGNAAGNDQIDFLVVAGGGGGGGNYAGGAGGGGFRESKQPCAPWTASPIVATPGSGTNGITATATGYPIAVGAGGTGSAYPCTGPGNQGVASIFSTITSAGGGYAGVQTSNAGGTGGSGGASGGTSGTPGASGNTPPTTPAQGFDGGNNSGPGTPHNHGGGGGATEAGVPGVPAPSGRGGTGATTSISETPTSYSGGGGGSGGPPPPAVGGAASPCGSGAAGGIQFGVAPTVAPSAAANTGGGGGSTTYNPGGTGGSGIVIIRYKFQ